MNITEATAILNDDTTLLEIANNNSMSKGFKTKANDTSAQIAVGFRVLLKADKNTLIVKRFQGLYDLKNSKDVKQVELAKSYIKVLQDALRQATNPSARKNDLWSEDYGVCCSTKKNNGIAHIYSNPHPVKATSEVTAKAEVKKAITTEQVYNYCDSMSVADINALINHLNKQVKDKLKQVA